MDSHIPNRRSILSGRKLVIAMSVTTMCLLLGLLPFTSGSAQTAVGVGDPFPRGGPALLRAMQMPQPDEYEPDDAKYQANRITVNDPHAQRHNFHDADDEDWVKFWAWAGNTYTITTSDLEFGCDTVLELYDAESHKLREDDDGGEEPRASKIDAWTPSENGTYYVRVSQYQPTGGNLGYSLRITDIVTCKDEYEPDDTCDNAKEIHVGESQTHNFHGPCGGDEDWVWFEAVGGTVYTIWTSNLEGSNDTVLCLYDEDCNPLNVCNDDDPDNIPASRIVWEAPMDGRYYVKVSHFEPSAGKSSAGECNVRYSLSLATLPSPPPTPTPTPPPLNEPDQYEPDDAKYQANRISVNGTPQVHTFHRWDDEDWVKFWAWAGNKYTIRTFDLESGNNTTLGLYDVESHKLEEDLGPGASRIDWTAPEDGTYFVRVAPPKVGVSGYYGLSSSDGLAYSLEVREAIPCRDEYEPDDTCEGAEWITVGEVQHRNFHVPCFNSYHPPDAADWVKFNATEGVTYTIKTSHLEGGNDTTLCLYDEDCNPLNVCNDDYRDDFPASKIVWHAPADGTYYVKVSPFEPLAGGCDFNYDLEVTLIPGPPCTLTLECPFSLTVGETSILTATVVDTNMNPVEDGTEVTFETNPGCFETPEGCKVSSIVTTTDGVATAGLTSTEVCTATVTVTALPCAAGCNCTDTCEVTFVPGEPYTVTLEADPEELTVGETSHLIATVEDQFGNKVADSTKVIFKTDLGNLDSNSNEVIKRTEDGIAAAELTSTEAGTATVIATSGEASDSKSITFNPISIYLPLVLKPPLNHSPYTPTNPLPPDWPLEKQPINVCLSWSGGDPDPEDTVTYDVYLGSSSPKETIGPYPATQTSITYCPECLLSCSTAYYWRIVARDNHGVESEGPEWHFETFEFVPCPDDPVYPTPSEGWGPICSSKPYEGVLCRAEQEERKGQWFFMDITTLDRFTIDLDVPDNGSSDYDIYVYCADTLEEAREKAKDSKGLCYSEEWGNADEHADCDPTSIGRYYICVRCWENPDSNNPYILRATYR